jgi:ribose 5-phosphate isomerase B
MKLGITNDHPGVGLKNALKAAFPDVDWVDVGTQNADESVDYPDYGYKLAELIENGSVERGVAVCGSGIGICIAVNRSRAVRGGVAHNVTDARLMREHNDANVICFGARFMTEAAAIECLKTFLSTEFEGGRHVKRVEKLS